MMMRVKYVKVIRGEECFSQYRLLGMDLAWENEPIRKKKELGEIKLWTLKNDKIRKVVKDQVKEIIATPKSFDD